MRVNDLKVFQRNPLKPFWPPLTIQREFDAYVLSLGLIRYDLPDPTSKPACRAVIECTQASSSEYHGNLFSYLGHKQLLNSVVQRIGNRRRRRKARKRGSHPIPFWHRVAAAGRRPRAHRKRVCRGSVQDRLGPRATRSTGPPQPAGSRRDKRAVNTCQQQARSAVAVGHHRTGQRHALGRES